MCAILKSKNSDLQVWHMNTLRKQLSHWWWKYGDCLPSVNEDAKRSFSIGGTFIGFFALVLTITALSEASKKNIPITAFASDKAILKHSVMVTTGKTYDIKITRCSANLK